MSQLSLLGPDETPQATDRLFFAVMPDAAAVAQITSLGESLKRRLGLKGRLIEPARLHVTLHHLGDHPGLPSGLVEQAMRAGAAVQCEPFDVSFERAESFAGRPRNRPFVLRGDGLQGLTAFQQALGAQMSRAGLGRWVEARFTPHVTLAYDDQLVPAQPVSPVSWRVGELVLVHSLLGRHRHVVLGRWALGAGEPAALSGARRPGFPLKLAATAPVQRRLVTPPHDKPSASRQALGARPGATSAAAPMVPLPPRVPPATSTQQASALPPALAARLSQWQAQGLPGARMIERLIADGCHDQAVLEAFARVPRHAFVDPALLSQAYEDTSLPIGLGQTISKPTVVARMLALLRARPGGPHLGRVLEIGTGCGYQAALLALLARQVYSVERLQALFEKAREKLAPIRADNLRLILADGRLGHGPNAPYDGIIAAAGGQDLPAAWLDQLAPGGRLVAPAHDEARAAQVLWVVDRLPDGSLRRVAHEAVRFVPLESGVDSRRL